MKASKEEVVYHQEIASFVSDLSCSMKERFASILKKTTNHRSFLKVSRVPTTINDLSKFYTSNSTSILQNIPYPEVNEKDNHAYVSIVDVILHMFGYGFKMYNDSD